MVSSTRASTASSAESSARPARILSIDYGRRRIGLAISDELGLTARPLEAVERKNRREDLRRLREIAVKNEVRLVLVGLPVHLSGRSSEMSDEATQFAQRIGKELGLPVRLRDERLTSWEAEQMAHEFGLKKDTDTDSLAAAILLREYLNEAPCRAKTTHGIDEPCEK